ncbi:hypothetical protein C8T65DRAFT_206230 [Cerioporus squamosus]|nr:hypothetical protein C8T65DRAFT_206230 [Cerioporus squamosus]
MLQPDMNVSALYLPAHQRLGATKWPEFKHTIETICRVVGVEDHLTSETPVGEWYPEDWAARDELCKAIITLNVRDFPRYGVLAGKDTPAHAVWAHLVKIHEPRFGGLFKWLRPLTMLEWALLGLVILLLWYLVQLSTLARLMATEIIQARRSAALQDWMKKSLRLETVRAAKDMYFSSRGAGYGLLD